MSNSAIVKDVLDNGLRILTERMSQVRSVSVGVWLTRGSRHETAEYGGIAHFVEHMLFKGTPTRSAEDIAQAIDSIGGQLEAFTSKESAGYYIKVLDEHLPRALDLLSDIVLNPKFSADDIEREKKVVIEEIKMVEDQPDDLVLELFTQGFWENHPLGRPILGTRETVGSFDTDSLRRYFAKTYTPRNLIVSAAGNFEHEQMRALVNERFGGLQTPDVPVAEESPSVARKIIIRNKDLEQSLLCLGTSSYPQNHGDRYAVYLLDIILGGSMSSRLFQNIRERRGLAYAVSSNVATYRDTGSFTIHAGCANEAVGEVVDLVVEEIKTLKRESVPEGELQRSKDHLKGSLMLSLESTANRMSHLARQEMYFGRQIGLDETIDGINKVTATDLQRVAEDLFKSDALSATVLGNVNGLELPLGRLALD